jgi:serine/threonine protein kinase
LGRHPNVNAFLGLYENKKYYMIVLEYMKGGELLDILIRRVEAGQLNYSEAQVAIILRCVCRKRRVAGDRLSFG